MAQRKKEACHVVRSADCEAPPAYGPAAACRCFRCGLDVCRTCSTRVLYLRYGRRRICLECLDEMARVGELELCRFPAAMAGGSGRPPRCGPVRPG